MGTLATLADLDICGWDLEQLSPTQQVEAARALKGVHLAQARGEKLPDELDHLVTGAAAFAEYAIPHERTGERIENADFHEEWHEFLDRQPYGVILAPVGHGKTQQLLARILYALGKDPNLRIGLVCASDEQAKERLAQLRAHLIGNERIREVFPDLQLDPRAKCNEHQLTVVRSTTAKDPSIRAYSVGSRSITGARLDVLVMDDVLDRDNTATPELRAKMLEWFDTKAWTRQTPGEPFRVWVIGTPWHAEDLLHVLKDRPAWGAQVWSAVLNPEDPPSTWETLWAPFTREHALMLQENSTPHAFSRKYLTRVSDDASSRFRQEWIRQCLLAGAGRTLLDQPPTQGWNGPFLPCFTGVDLGVGQEEGHDLTCLFTIALLPDRRRLVVDIQSGRWQAPEIVQRIVRTTQRYRSIAVVESNAAQRFIYQFAGEADIDVEPFTTGRNKMDEAWGVESLAIEMRARRWVIPSGPSGEARDPEISAWLRECRDYQPKLHTGDRLMASWFAQHRARAWSPDAPSAGEPALNGNWSFDALYR